MPKPEGRQKYCLASGVVVVVICLMCGCIATPVAKQAICTCDSKTAAGPWGSSRLAFADRLDRGYTIVLPGIWGAQPIDYGIVKGLQDGDVQSAIELHDWTAGALRLIYNLRAINHNQGEARKIAAKIVAY